MKIKPVFKSLSHTGVKLTVADKDIELTRHKVGNRKKEQRFRNAVVNHIHLNTPFANATIKTAWDKTDEKFKPEELLNTIKVDKKGLAIGKLNLGWELKKNKK